MASTGRRRSGAPGGGGPRCGCLLVQGPAGTHTIKAIAGEIAPSGRRPLQGARMSRRSRPISTGDRAWVESVPILRQERYSQSLERGLAILGCFSPETPTLGLADIADRLRMAHGTTHRYAKTLVALGYLEQNAITCQYRLALGVTRLGMEAMNGMSLREQARPLLHELRQRTKFTASLAILDGTAIQYVDRVLGVRQGQHRTLKITVGTDLPAHNTAVGKLLLAYLPAEPRRELVLELTLTKTGPKTITNAQRLSRELREIGEDGIAVADEELAPRLIAIAAPVRDISREAVAAVGLAADSTVIDVEVFEDKLSPHLIATADRLSARLGYRREDEPSSALSDIHGFTSGWSGD